MSSRSDTNIIANFVTIDTGLITTVITNNLMINEGIPGSYDGSLVSYQGNYLLVNTYKRGTIVNYTTMTQFQLWIASADIPTNYPPGSPNDDWFLIYEVSL